MNKRILAGALAFCMVSLALSACTKPDTMTKTSSDMTSSTKVSSDKPEEKITLQYTYFAESGDTVSLYQKMCEDFTKENPNIQVDFTPIVDDYKTKLIVMVASKTAPDVAWIGEDMVQTYAEQKALLPLDEYDGKLLNKSDYIESNLAGYQVGGMTYALPFDSATGLLFVNTDIMKASNITLPDDYMTWEQLRDIAKKTTMVKDGVTSQYGFVTGPDMDYIHPFVKMAGGDYIDANNMPSFNTDAVKKTYKFFDTLMREDKSMPAYGSSAISFTEIFKSGKAAMMFNGSWAVGEVMSQKDFNCAIVRLPKDKNIATPAWTGGTGVLSSTKYPEQSVKFLSWFCGEPGQTIKFNGKFAASPTLKSLINTELAYKGYTSPEAPNNDFTYLTDALGHAYILPATVFSNAEIRDQINKTTEKYFLGAVTVDEMAKELDTTVGALLAMK